MYFPGSEKYISMVSEPFDSLDAEFRNGVYATLARHESKFNLLNKNINQIKTALQSILTELRTLRVNHNGNTVETFHRPTNPPPPELGKTITEFQQAFTIPTTLPPKKSLVQPHSSTNPNFDHHPYHSTPHDL